MLKNKVHAVLLALSIAVVAGGLSGCAPASPDAMAIRGVPNLQHFQKTVSVKTQGGGEADDPVNIPNKDFAKAIEASILENRVFTQVLPVGAANYELNVSIINMSKPMFGASFTIDLEAAWSLTNTTTKAVVMRESIKSTATATMSQAFVGATRYRMAVEGAAQDNIRQGLIAISKLKLD